MTHFPFPFWVGANGRTTRPSTNEHILQMIDAVLFTSPGERVNRPEFGSGVLDLIFAGGSEELVATAEFRVQAVIQQWLGDLVQVEAVQVTVEDSTLSIMLEYTTRINQARQLATFSREV